jgi:hypothetical protein
MDALAADDLEYNYDKAGLAALRRRLAAAIHDFKGAHAQYEEVIRQVRGLQQVGCVRVCVCLGEREGGGSDTEGMGETQPCTCLL